MKLYTVWNKHTSVSERCLINQNKEYVGVETGNKYIGDNYRHSQQFKAIIVYVDDKNMTGMYHLNEDYESGNEPNHKSKKSKYIGCEVTVEKAHMCGELAIYRCLELGEYFSSNELAIYEETKEE